MDGSTASQIASVNQGFHIDGEAVNIDDKPVNIGESQQCNGGYPAIPTLASNLNRECGKDLGGSGVPTDTKTDTGFSTPSQLRDTGVNSPTTR